MFQIRREFANLIFTYQGKVGLFLQENEWLKNISHI